MHDYIRDLATTLGSSGAISAMCALAAGLAAIALAAGVARLPKKSVPEHFPADAEARQGKYALAFSQLAEARQGHPEGLTNIIASMKGQPAAALCLQAFEEFSQSLDEDSASAKSAAPAQKQKPEPPKLGGSMKSKPSINIGGPAKAARAGTSNATQDNNDEDLDGDDDEKPGRGAKFNKSRGRR